MEESGFVMHRIAEEIRAYHNLRERHGGRTAKVGGMELFCPAGDMPPKNRVTSCFVDVVSHLSGDVALDLGCGIGVLALAMAAGFRRVVGVDRSGRAVACARENATRNSVRNVSFLRGHGYQPVVGQKFTLIVCNPPFYPPGDWGPAGRLLCEQPGGRSLIESLISGSREHLSQDGMLIFVTSSLSQNRKIEELLNLKALVFQRELLRKGKPISQDLYLWTVSQ